MKASIVNFVLLFLICLNAAAAAQGDRRDNSIKKGVWALQFQITNNFTLSSFDGSVLSAKYHLSKTRALRLGLGVDLVLVDSDDRVVDTRADTLSAEFSEEADSDRWGFELNLQYLFYPIPDGNIHLFFGAGPLLGYDRVDSEITRSSIDSFSELLTATNKTSSWSVGVSSVLGVEWFAAKQISILAEYGLSLRYQWIESSRMNVANDRTLTHDEERDTFTVNASAVRFGLSVYF